MTFLENFLLSQKVVCRISFCSTVANANLGDVFGGYCHRLI